MLQNVYSNISLVICERMKGEEKIIKAEYYSDFS